MPAPIESTRPEAIRAFVALPVSPPVLEALASAQRAWIDRLPRGAVRWTPPEQIHLTVKFLGDVPSAALAAIEAALEAAVAGARPLRLTAGGYGCFPQERDPRVLWVGLAGDVAGLLQLQGRIDQALSVWVPREAREFHPHLTLGRIKFANGATRQALREGLMKAGQLALSWSADRVELIRSELGSAGATHTVLRSWLFSVV